MNRKNRLGRTTTAAFLVFVFLMLLTVIPQFSLVTVWLLPIPLIVLYATKGNRVTIVLSSVLSIILVLIGFGWTGLLFGLAVYYVAWVMGEALRRVESPSGPLITGSLVVIMLELVLLALMHYSGVRVSDLISLIATSEAQMTKMDVTSLKQSIVLLTEQIRFLLPALISIWAFLIVAVNVTIARWMLARTIPLRPLLSTWRLPYWVTASFVVSTAVVFFKAFQENPILWQIFNCISVLAGFFIVIQGWSLLWRLLRNTRARRIYLVCIILFSFVPFVTYLYLLIGMFDTFRSNYRK